MIDRKPTPQGRCSGCGFPVPARWLGMCYECRLAVRVGMPT